MAFQHGCANLVVKQGGSMQFKHLVFAIMLAFTSIAHAQTPEQLAAAERAASIGNELFEHDQAAWHGTDAMLEDIRDPHGEGLSGWITERTPEGIQVLFLKPRGDSVTAIYRALYRDGQIRERGRIDEPLTEVQTRLNRARLIATQAPMPQQCAERYNSVTLPRDTPGAEGADVDVYLMPAMTRLDQVPFGGHFRLAVDTTVGVVRETQRFTNGCIALPIARNAAALMITQLIGDTPTEVHVFESLTIGKPVYVSTNSAIWSVTGREITFVSAREPSAQR
ncbi:MAG: hypothetical protein NT015_01315 [Alphaproteobacteria bacterium]|nr:hypothetical protein [Alphaproteobacteria bacterium]